MLESRAKWQVETTDWAAAEALGKEMKLAPVVAGMLIARGITNKEEAERFLHGGKDHFHDPFLLDGMEAAVARIRQALKEQAPIRVYGDYDADGVSSTALMTYALRRLGACFDTYIPHRQTEGYGMNVRAIDLAKESGVSLMITVDTGISAREQVAYAASLGIDVIVTDHHEPPELLPDAVAVINPKKQSCPYPFKSLAGVGVAFKLAHALLEEPPLDLLELAALGTVADLMPLEDENRAIVKLGLQRMQTSAFKGIRALLDVSGVTDKEVTAGHLGFSLAPRINASGRLEHADEALALLTTEDREEAERIAESLDELNRDRQRIVEEMTADAIAMFEEQERQGHQRVVIVAREDWNVGVVGIVAARILEKVYRPVIVLSIDRETGLAKGSARSITGYDMHRALTACSELLDHYGGHQAAAGMTLHRDHVPELRRRMDMLAEQWLTDDQLVPVMVADCALEMGDITIELIRQIGQLAPFGMGNPSPRFVFSDLHVKEKKALGRDKQHLKLLLADPARAEAAPVEALGFGRGEWLDQVSATAKIDLLGELGVNEWNGVRKPQIVIQDMRIPHAQVFDWRAVKQAVSKFLSMPSSASSEQPGARAIVVEANAPTRSLDPDRVACGLWAMDAGRGAVPLNRAAAANQFELAEDVLLLALPDELAALERMLSGCRAKRMYAAFSDWDRDYAKVPSRDEFKALYKLLIAAASWTRNDPRFLSPLVRRLGLSESLLLFMMDVFEELGFMKTENGTTRIVPSPKKREFGESALYRTRLARQETEQTLVYATGEQLTEWVLSRISAQSKPMMEGIG